VLKIVNLETTYNDVILALKGISLEVPEGGIVALLGANGAGKTTTINTISGFRKSLNLVIEDGTIEFYGENINDKEPYEIVSRGILQVPEGRRIFAELNVEENISVGSFSAKDRRKLEANKKRVFGYFPILEERRSQPAGYLSGGEQQMLAIGRALMADPKLIMLDEPSLGLAPMIVREIFSIVHRISQHEKRSILLVEQNAKMALSISQYGYILENGRIVMDAISDKLKNDKDIKEFYLGLTEVGIKKSFREVKHYKRRKRWLS
jgi:branched-chain amino acid transport system ATP-binding protein